MDYTYNETYKIMNNTNDKILINNLELFCIVGINNWERITPQKIVIDLEIETNLNLSIESDDISKTVNYRTIVKNIIKIIGNSKYKLIESIAGRICEICFEDNNIIAVEISVFKPGAVRNTKSVGVSIRREKNKQNL